MEKVKVDIEWVYYLRMELAKINKLDFDQIEWQEWGEKLDIPSHILSDWELTGLNNVDFIMSGSWREKKVINENGN